MSAKSMNWKNLLSYKRVAWDGTDSIETDEDIRGQFARDYDRVLFSTSFRRLADKTQVFPIPENDHVHSRLNHSIEVASIGRAVAISVGRYVLEMHRDLRPEHNEHDFGDIVAAACLAHDIGNPPFGHSGEDAIKSFFRSWIGSNFQSIPEEPRQEDLKNFDGNPQGFRVISRLQNEGSRGLKLTAATLASFVKYPRPSQCSGSPKQNGKIYAKHGIFQSEWGLFRKVAEIVGLREQIGNPTIYCRHPLAFIVEAADDVSNFILDLEDAWRLGYVSKDAAIELLEPIAKKDPILRATSDEKELIISLRARAFRVLRREIVDAFKKNYVSIMDGTQNSSLIENDEEPSKAICSHAEIRKIKDFSIEKIYAHKNVLRIEIPGYQVLMGLLEEIIPAILADSKSRSKYDKKLVNLFGFANVSTQNAEQSIYERVLRASDFVAGMTDGFAISQYQLIKGMKVDPTVK